MSSELRLEVGATETETNADAAADSEALCAVGSFCFCPSLPLSADVFRAESAAVSISAPRRLRELRGPCLRLEAESSGVATTERAWEGLASTLRLSRPFRSRLLGLKLTPKPMSAPNPMPKDGSSGGRADMAGSDKGWNDEARGIATVTSPEDRVGRGPLEGEGTGTVIRPPSDSAEEEVVSVFGECGVSTGWASSAEEGAASAGDVGPAAEDADVGAEAGRKDEEALRA